MVLMLRSVEDVQRHLPKWQVWRVRRDVTMTSRSRSKAVEVGVEVLDDDVGVISVSAMVRGDAPLTG
jgi:hypothetical protein